MTLQEDIQDLPDEVQEGQTGHRTYHETIHEALKTHELRLTVEEAKTFAWSDITNKPSTFAPAVHSHTIANITNLQSTLDGKAASSHTHTIANVFGLQTQLDTKPTLVDGKLPTSYLNRVSIGETLEASSEAAMLGLNANLGDVAIRTDNDGLFMLKKLPSTTAANWLDLGAALSGVAGVTSWNGQTGTVVAGKADIGLGNVDNTSDVNKPVSNATQTALYAKQNVSSAVSGSSNGTATASTLWIGTQAQYDAIGSKSSTTVYVVTA